MMDGMKRLLIALASATVLLACGEAGPPVNPRDAVLDAMMAVYEAGTVHQEFEMSMSAAGQSFVFTGEGDVDNERQLASMTMDLGLMGGRMDMIIDGGVVYMRSSLMPDVGTEWVSMDPSKVDPAAAGQFGLGAGSTDPAAYVGLFAGVIAVEARGEEEIGGVATTRYAGTIDLGKVLENFVDVAVRDVPRASREQLGTAIEQLEGLGLEKRLPFEIWIDGQGFPRRQRLSMDLGSILPGAEDASFEMTVDFSRFGLPIDVEIPRPSQVTDMTELLGASGASGASGAYG